MRENRLSGSEGGATLIPSSLPLSIIQSLRDKDSQRLSTFFEATSLEPIEDEDDDEDENEAP